MSTQPGHAARDLLAICAGVVLLAGFVALIVAARINT